MKTARYNSRGFSLLELLMVVVVALILMAIAIPNLMGYYRFYKIRGASREVTEEIERARFRAINRGVNLGVVFVVMDQTRYLAVIEDDAQKGVPPDWQAVRLDWATLTSAPLDQFQMRPVQTLPAGVIFDNACVSQTGAGAGAPNNSGIRFDRLGRVCGFGDVNCESPPGIPAFAPFIVTDVGGATACLQEVTTGLTSWVTVSRGGRVRSRQEFE